jgi:hypothetical protein
MDNDTVRSRSAANWVLLLATLTCSGYVAAQDGAGAQDGDAAARDESSVAQACLNHPTIRRTKVLNDRNIVFVTRDNQIYNNPLPRQCPGLRRNSVVNYGIANSRLCAGGLFQVLWEQGINNYLPAAVCKLGNFVPITEAELADLTAMTDVERGRRSGRRSGRSSREAVTTEQVELPPPSEPAATE